MGCPSPALPPDQGAAIVLVRDDRSNVRSEVREPVTEAEPVIFSRLLRYMLFFRTGGVLEVVGPSSESGSLKLLNLTD